ncbi:serine hydrolase [Actinomycetospora sp. CA-101289]|uniref:serine hydrolase n=1 Tax=Actinomycetospora sp. CA-101289 TaxID=3239893 RepID=UPI003D9A02BE
MIAGPSRRAPRLAAAALVAAALVGGCARPEAPPPVAAPAPVATTPRPTTPPPTTTTTPAPTPSRAQAAVDATAPAERERRGVTLGVAVLDRTTGQITANGEADTPLRTASVAKLFTIVDVLTRRAAGQVTVTPSDEQRIRRALTLSDDEAMNGLYSRFGGPEGIERVSALVGLRATSPSERAGQWGETLTSARDVATLYAFILTRLAPADRDLVLSSLEAAPATAADGFDQGFGLLDPARRGTAAAKQGWLCCLQSSVDLHSTGLPDLESRYVLVLLSNQPRGYDAARTLLDDAAGAARDALAS